MKPHTKQLFILLFSVFSLHFAYAQSDASNIKSAALEMGKAMTSRNGEIFVKYMHPSTFKLAGGKSNAVKLIDSVFHVFEQLGGKVSRISYGTPSNIVAFKNTLQSVLPQTTYVTSLIGDAELSSNLIAISSDKGKSWTFIDTNMFSMKEIKKEMPDISPELVFPKPPPLKFSMNQ